MEAVTPDTIHRLAGRLMRDDGLCLAVIGPRGAAQKAERALRLP
jgi:hypothetical protein